MNRALWLKAMGDARLLLSALALLLFIFPWLFVWLTSLVELGAFAVFLQALPDAVESLVGVPLSKVATPTGRIAMAYVDPVVLLAVVSWAVARGSDVVSGELDRGTLELLLAQPTRRSALVITQGVVTVAGAAILAFSLWLGTYVGLKTVDQGQPVLAAHFVPGAINVFALTFFLAGVSTLVSACDTYRWRTIGVMVGFYVVELIVKIVARLAPNLDWLMYGTFLGAFEPQVMIVLPERAVAMSWRYDCTLIGLGLAAYVLATVTFSRRDLPAPL